MAKSWPLVSDAGLAVVAGVRGPTTGLVLVSPVYEWGAELVGVSVEEADSSARHAGSTRGVDVKPESASRSGDGEAESIGGDEDDDEDDGEEGKEAMTMFCWTQYGPNPSKA